MNKLTVGEALDVELKKRKFYCDNDGLNFSNGFLACWKLKEKQLSEIEEYALPHHIKMWSAKILSILWGVSFRETALIARDKINNQGK